MTESLDGPVGPVSHSTLRQIRDLLLEEEPLVETAAFDDPVNPTELVVTFAVGHETPGRLEVTWWQRDAYRFHYTEPGGLDFRFDNHPKETAPDAHFHPPPDGSPAEPSFLDGVSQPQVVTRAILARWRDAVVAGEELDVLNRLSE